MRGNPKIGTKCEQRFVVEPKHAIDFADGRMPAVLCTPWLVWFLEHAAREAVLPLLEGPSGLPSSLVASGAGLDAYAAKRRILEIVFLNCRLEDVNLVPTMRKPFDVLAEGLLLKNSRGDWICARRSDSPINKSSAPITPGSRVCGTLSSTILKFRRRRRWFRSSGPRRSSSSSARQCCQGDRR
jgi:hypothetical protein